MVDQSSGSAIGGGSGNYTGKSPDELIQHGKQLFTALGNLDQTERRRVVDEWRGDPAVAQMFDQMERTG